MHLCTAIQTNLTYHVKFQDRQRDKTKLSYLGMNLLVVALTENQENNSHQRQGYGYS